jgi:DNA-binding TFAR19-related protein (PDSD5 family)
MRRGTRVGQAYVAITADGSGINEEIVDSVDAAGDDIDKKGDEHGERYGDHFSEGFFARMRSRFRSRLAQELEPELNRSGQDSGQSFSRNFLDGLDDQMMNRVADRIGASVGGHMIDALNHALTSDGHDGNVLKGLFDKLMADAESVSGNGRPRNKDKGLTGLDDWLSNSRFRNNALNILAKSFGGVIHGFERVALLSKEFVSNMKNAEEGASLFQKLGAGFGGGGAESAGLFSKALSGIAASGPGAAVAIVAITAAATILVSVLNALLAIVVALAATIASALVGAVLVGGAALGALTAAAGLTTLAFMSMDDQQEKMLKSAFKPLHQEAIGLGQVMLKDLVPAFAVWSKNLQTALGFAEPLASVLGGALAKGGGIFTKSLSGPGVRQFLDALSVNLPGIVKNLSRALGGFLNGVGSLFAAIMPDVRQFSRWLSGIATDFAKWASSAAGQNAIVDFVDRALTSLHSLNSFIGAVSGLIAHLLFSTQGQNAGNSIFDDMTQGIRNFTAYLTPDRLQRWFDQGKSLAKGLGDALKAVADVLATFNSAGVISGIQSVAHGAAVAADAYRQLPTAIQYAINPLKAVELTAKATAAGVVSAVAVIVGAFYLLTRAAAKVVGLLAKIPGAPGWLKGLAKSLDTAADNVQGLTNKLLKMPRDILISVGADTDPAAKAVNRLVSQVSKYHINIPVTVSTNATVAEGAAISAASPTTSGGSGSVSGLISSGQSALANTTTGTHKAPKYHNPYKAFAKKLIDDGPSVAAQIRNAILTVNGQVRSAILDAARSADLGSLQNSLSDLISSMTTSATETVNTAQQALNSAAESLLNATSKSAAKKALKAVKRAQKDLAAAVENQKKIQAAAKIVAAQRITDPARVAALLQGFKVVNATLADYAAARSQVTQMLQDANQKLADAISLRDSYKTSVTDSINSFAALMTVQAQTIDGIQQALTAGDITTTLQDRLDKIKKFQDDLRLLLAEGLSNAAYKQIVDAGVEQGTTIADALLAGGTGAVQQTNSLVDQINGIADSLGVEASNRMYQAGVDAAQGLVDGLTSLSAQLDSAAAALGTAIAAAVKRALGIASPSRVLMDMMDYVGDGAAIGLDNQHTKVGSAARRFSDMIAVSPEVASYAQQQRQTEGQRVSGNQSDPRFRDLIIHTPTEDPHAVAIEALNEVIGRL